MKKLRSLAFYALVTPSITLGSGALVAEEDRSGDRDVGEQSMGHDADPETQSSQQDKEVIKSKYNTSGQTDEKTGNQAGKQNKGHKESSPDNGERPDQD